MTNDNIGAVEENKQTPKVPQEMLLEFFEIIINQVLYLRKVYPSQIFRKQKAFGLPVFISIYPPLNAYLKNVLTEADTLISREMLSRMEIRLFTEDEIVESFFVDLGDHEEPNSEDLESELMNCINSLEKRSKTFLKLPEDCKFKVLLHTKSYDFADPTRHADFIWVKDTHEVPPGSITPIVMHSQTNFVQFYVERQ